MAELESKNNSVGRLYGMVGVRFCASAWRFVMTSGDDQTVQMLMPGMLRRVHHVALHVKDMDASRHFYGVVLGLRELTGEEVPSTLKQLFEAGKVANFITPDGTILDLFWKPNLLPPDVDPGQEFTRAGHLAFDIEPEMFEQAVEVIRQNQIPIDHGPVSRPTGRGVYFYDPDGFLIEIRCDPVD